MFVCNWFVFYLFFKIVVIYNKIMFEFIFKIKNIYFELIIIKLGSLKVFFKSNVIVNKIN